MAYSMASTFYRTPGDAIAATRALRTPAVAECSGGCSDECCFRCPGEQDCADLRRRPAGQRRHRSPYIAFMRPI